MFKLAFLNLLRYKKRTIITAFAIALGVAIGIYMQALLKGVNGESERNLLWYETSAAKIYNKDWYHNKEYYPIDSLISHQQVQGLEKLLAENHITNYSKEFLETCDVSFYQDPYTATGSIKALIHGLSDEGTGAYHYAEATREGSWISKGSEGVVIGAKLADDIGAQKGYYLTIQAKGKGGFITAFDVPIIGIIQTGNPLVDTSSLFFDYDFISDMLELQKDISSIAFSFGKNNVTSTIKTTKKITPLLKEIAATQNLVAHPWTDIAEEVLTFAKSDKSSAYLIIFFIFAIAIVGVTNTMIMAMSERKNEIAMLRSLGYRRNYITLLFSIESGLLGCIGSIFGIILGLIPSIYNQTHGINFSGQNANLNMGYRMSAIMYTDIDYKNIVFLSLLTILFCILASFLAVHNATKGEIVEKLRGM